MITVKLFGLLRLESGIKELRLEADSVAQVQKILCSRSDRITKKEIEGCVILINGKPGNKRSRLDDGDQVVLMSPVAGG